MLDNILAGEGFEVEHTGGGCHLLSLYLPSGNYLWVSSQAGSDVPTWADWYVGAYPAEWDGDVDAMLFNAWAEDSLFGLREAVAAAIAIAKGEK
jgi:hypothetical protein